MPLKPALLVHARHTIKTAYDELDRTITPGDKRDFGDTTLRNVRQAARDIENQLAAQRSLRNMRRLMPFFLGLEYYSRAVDTLCNGTPYLPWIWAPLTIILRVASEYAAAFDQIIKAYSSIAEPLRRFEILSDAFMLHDPEFHNTLAVFYADILEIHGQTYKLVRRSNWKAMFSTSSARFQKRIHRIVEDLNRHGSLIDQWANRGRLFGARNAPEDMSQSQIDREATNELQYTTDNEFAVNMIDSATEPALEFASHLCYRCNTVDSSNSRLVIEYPLDHLREGAGACKLCTLLFQAVKNSQGSGSSASLPNMVSFHRKGSVLSLGSGGPAVLSLCAGPASSMNLLTDIQRGVPMLNESRSPERFNLLRRFLRYCDEQHHSCMPEHTGSMPARLIDVKDLRLVDTENLSPKERYAALSWSRRVGWNVLEALRTQLVHEFDFASLPLTIQDAVIVTKSLGIKFLWIDSLCIIQDEEESWKREVRSMGNIFRNAYCTIAATSARDLSDGFLRPRPPRNFVSLYNPEGIAISVCEQIDDFQGDVENVPLNEWVGTFRERVMSRRIIHFAENQFYWQCGDGIHCETLTKMSRPFNFLLQDPNSTNTSSLERVRSGFRVSQMLYELFSRLELRWPSDRLEEIAEVESFLARDAQTTAAYGLFDGDMARGLLWRRADIKALVPIRPSVECPSWSWMAYSGRIVYMGVAKLEHGVHWADVKVHDSPTLRKDPPSRQLRISGDRVSPKETVNVVYDDGHKERDMGAKTTGVSSLDRTIAVGSGEG
ncbi:hypothetical protein BHE90_009823 [Fusarium euwallaceae]|uniref:Uncharacterized protein n=1 Tax=Fusarium euwallaceae TaxID=1147111 RepID=A0A430LIX5_9HYPO|nr:hypothetical protein BHE90_009823 [Fusarium euwallaceae]